MYTHYCMSYRSTYYDVSLTSYNTYTFYKPSTLPRTMKEIPLLPLLNRLREE